MTMTLEDMLNYSEMYDVRYRVMDTEKGLINFPERKIYIDIGHNEDAITYVHEMLHHHHSQELGIDVPECEIEREAQEFYAQHTLFCEKVTLTKLHHPYKININDIGLEDSD